MPFGIKVGTERRPVAQHIGDDTVRCIAMSSTDGLVEHGGHRYQAPISVPVGKGLWEGYSMFWASDDEKGRLKQRKLPIQDRTSLCRTETTAQFETELLLT